MGKAIDFFSQPVHAPVQEFQLPAFDQADVSVWIKREDLIHPFVSGNKWRKLKYNLMEAETQEKRSLLTFGGAYSNHLVAVAAAAACCGFMSKGFVRGDEKPRNHMLYLCETFGMELIYVDRTTYKDKEALTQQKITETTYVLDEGGTNALAVEGCAEIAAEVNQHFDHVFAACGTGGTLAGLAKGFATSAPQTQVHGIAVLKNGGFLKEVVESFVPGLLNWQLHLNEHKGGYGKTSPELLRLIQETAADTGILFDQVYTAKVLMALLRMLDAGEINRGSKILLLHTGGALGYLSQHG